MRLGSPWGKKNTRYEYGGVGSENDYECQCNLFVASGQILPIPHQFARERLSAINSNRLAACKNALGTQNSMMTATKALVASVPHLNQNQALSILNSTKKKKFTCFWKDCPSQLKFFLKTIETDYECRMVWLLAQHGARVSTRARWLLQTQLPRIFVSNWRNWEWNWCRINFKKAQILPWSIFWAEHRAKILVWIRFFACKLK